MRHLARLSVGVHHHDHRVAIRDLAQLPRGAASCLDEDLERVATQIMRQNLEAGAHEIRRHRCAHHPEPDEADAMHGWGLWGTVIPQSNGASFGVPTSVSVPAGSWKSPTYFPLSPSGEAGKPCMTPGLNLIIEAGRGAGGCAVPPLG